MRNTKSTIHLYRLASMQRARVRFKKKTDEALIEYLQLALQEARREAREAGGIRMSDGEWFSWNKDGRTWEKTLFKSARIYDYAKFAYKRTSGSPLGMDVLEQLRKEPSIVRRHNSLSWTDSKGTDVPASRVSITSAVNDFMLLQLVQSYIWTFGTLSFTRARAQRAVSLFISEIFPIRHSDAARVQYAPEPFRQEYLEALLARLSSS